MNVFTFTRVAGIHGAALAAALALGATAPLGAQTALSPQCAQPYGAMSKMFVAPFHLYMVDTAGTDARLHGGKPTVSEEVFINNTVYVMVNGRWIKSPVDIVEMRKDAMKNLETAKTTCTHLRDESVNGESASVWAVHSESEDGDSDSNAWISKSRNLVLRTEIRIDVGGALGKSHMVANYDYANVQAPAGVK
jgi:hypothetical protein